MTATDTLVVGESWDRSGWDLHPDGERFIIPVPENSVESAGTSDGAEPERFVVAVNWFAELRAILGGN